VQRTGGILIEYDDEEVLGDKREFTVFGLNLTAICSNLPLTGAESMTFGHAESVHLNAMPSLQSETHTRTGKDAECKAQASVEQHALIGDKGWKEVVRESTAEEEGRCIVNDSVSLPGHVVEEIWEEHFSDYWKCPFYVHIETGTLSWTKELPG